MVNTFADVQAKVDKDPEFFARLMMDPKRALQSANIELTSESDIKRLEFFVRNAQEQIKLAARHVGFAVVEANWGIGASCCNGQAFLSATRHSTDKR